MWRLLSVVAALVLAAGVASAEIPQPCMPVVYTGPAEACYFACPWGDTETFAEQGFMLAFTITGFTGDPIPGIPASDFWLIDCDPVLDLTLCAGSASSAADSATNGAGQTTMSNGTLKAGGCADGLSPVVQGFILEDPNADCNQYCFNIHVRSPDLDGSLVVNLVDLAIFSGCFPPRPYDTCCDLNCDATVNLQDLARFALHFGPPGHSC
jgi:hypothetical protein